MQTLAEVCDLTTDAYLCIITTKSKAKTHIIWTGFEKLLQEGEYSEANKEAPTVLSAICKAYWIIAAAICLAYRLLPNNWGPRWIIWVIAAALFPAVVAIANVFEKKSKGK